MPELSDQKNVPSSQPRKLVTLVNIVPAFMEWSLTDPSCPLQKRPPDPSVKKVLRPRPQPVQPPIQEIITIPETEITNNKVYGSWNLAGNF